MKTEWIALTDEVPTRGNVVMTKIDDGSGIRVRNVQTLKLSLHGNIWFHPTGDQYVYYCPTHWRPLTSEERVSVAKEKLQHVLEPLSPEARLKVLEAAIEKAQKGHP